MKKAPQKSKTLPKDELAQLRQRIAELEKINAQLVEKDATEKKDKERELERYRIFVEAMQEGVFEVDLKGNITFLNDAACRIFAYPADKLMGMNNREYTTPETAKRMFQIFSQIYETGQPQEIAEYEIIRGDGQIRYLNMTASLMTDDSGRPIGFRGIYKDVTERKRKEIKTRQLMEMVNHSRRMEAVGTLAAGVAHNFNNLLMSIQGFVSLISAGVPRDNPSHSSLKTIEDLIKRGADLTTKLMGYARHGGYAATPTDLRPIFRYAIKKFQKSYGDVDLIDTIPDTTSLVAANATQFEQLLTDILANAGEAMPCGGTLYIQTENTRLKESFTEPHGRKPGPFVKLSIRDTGIGMDQATCDRVFEPFFSTKHFSKGAGLGLASAYGIVNNHGGIILLDSKKDYGTKITIYWPALPKETQTDGHAGVEHTILVVDDDVVIRKLLERNLTKLGYNVITAENGLDAQKMIKANPEEIDLAIIDIMLPDLSGDQVVDAVRDLAPHIRFIMISGYPDSERVKDSMRDIRQAFLQKPIHPKALANTIRQLLDT